MGELTISERIDILKEHYPKYIGLSANLSVIYRHIIVIKSHIAQLEEDLAVVERALWTVMDAQEVVVNHSTQRRIDYIKQQARDELEKEQRQNFAEGNVDIHQEEVADGKRHTTIRRLQ